MKELFEFLIIMGLCAIALYFSNKGIISLSLFIMAIQMAFVSYSIYKESKILWIPFAIISALLIITVIRRTIDKLKKDSHGQNEMI